MSKSTIALIGTNGTLGKLTIGALTSSLFADKIAYPLHIVTKSKAGKEQSDKLKYFELGYDVSADELSTAFVGADIVIDLSGQSSDHAKIVDATLKAKAKVFIPSEFGTDYENIPYHLFDEKKEIADKAQKAGLKVVRLRTALFADWIIRGALAFGLNMPEKKATLIGDGSGSVSVSFLADVARVIASLASMPLNKLPEFVNIQSDVLTSKDVINIFESASGEKVQVDSITLESAQAKARDIEKNGGPKSFPDFLFILQVIGAEGKGLDFRANNDNEFVNPGLFQWTKFKPQAEKAWKH